MRTHGKISRDIPKNIARSSTKYRAKFSETSRDILLIVLIFQFESCSALGTGENVSVIRE